MNRTLPIKIDATVHTECWTYYKLAILEAYETGREWLSYHMPLYVDGTGSAWFGNSENTILGMKYFSDILTFEKMDFWGTSNDAIIDSIISLIDADKYVIIYLFAPPEFKKYHEFLIYGYDRKQKCFYTTLIKNGGRFCESIITFSDVRKGFSDIKKWYHNDKDTLESNSFWFFLYTAISINNEYKPDWSSFEMLQRLIKEAHGKGYIELNEFQQEEGFTSHKLFYGLACILGIKDNIKGLLESRQFINENMFVNMSNKLTRSLRKLYEYILIMNNGINRILNDKSLDCSSDECHIYVEEYERCCKKVEELYFASLKFRNNHDWRILDRLLLKTQEVYDDIKPAILNFVTSIKRIL